MAATSSCGLQLVIGHQDAAGRRARPASARRRSPCGGTDSRGRTPCRRPPPASSPPSRRTRRVTMPSVPTRSSASATMRAGRLVIGGDAGDRAQSPPAAPSGIAARRAPRSSRSTAASSPRTSSTGLAPSARRSRPCCTSASASTVAVVVPSPATSFVCLETSRSTCAPMFSNGSSSSISLAMLTPSRDTIGRADRPVHDGVHALGPERAAHGLRELGDASPERLARGVVVQHDLRHPVAFPLSSFRRCQAWLRRSSALRARLMRAKSSQARLAVRRLVVAEARGEQAAAQGRVELGADADPPDILQIRHEGFRRERHPLGDRRKRRSGDPPTTSRAVEIAQHQPAAGRRRTAGRAARRAASRPAAPPRGRRRAGGAAAPPAGAGTP